MSGGLAQSSAAPSAGRRVARNVVLLAVSPALRILIAIPLAGFVAHTLGLEDYGAFNFAYAFAALFGVLANVGLNETLLRSAAREPEAMSRLWANTLSVKCALLVGYLAVLILMARVLGQGASMTGLVLLMGIAQGLMSLENTSMALFSARQNMKPIAGLGSAKLVTEASATVVVLLAGAGVAGLAGSRALLAVAWLAVAVLVARRAFRLRWVQPSTRTIRPLLATGVSFAIIAGITQLNARAGILFLEHARGVEAVAIFSAAMLPVERIFLFVPAIQDAVFPFFSALRSDEDRRFSTSLGRAVRYQCLVAVGLGLGVSLVGPLLVRVVFPPAFGEAEAVLEILGLAVALRTLNGLLAAGVTARGQERAVAQVTGVQCLVVVSLAAVLSGPAGPVGVAWAVTAAEAVGLSFLLGLLWRRGGLAASQVARLALPASIGLALFAGFTLVPASRESLAFPLLFASAYPFLLVAARAVSREDLGYLLQVVGRSRRP